MCGCSRAIGGGAAVEPTDVLKEVKESKEQGERGGKNRTQVSIVKRESQLETT